ncbi:hypothetical protein NDU88_008021 [Pleurodeles waltl]|uniref:Uncharacterized protein n=1 Tax=Pleurodeles waltl TaxID=8319 RepID=A0AAV7QTC8_PLEWA|nr:hypothetical protein NDU88_008021 [Pleurodeles waltl]
MRLLELLLRCLAEWHIHLPKPRGYLSGPPRVPTPIMATSSSPTRRASVIQALKTLYLGPGCRWAAAVPSGTDSEDERTNLVEGVDRLEAETSRDGRSPRNLTRRKAARFGDCRKAVRGEGRIAGGLPSGGAVSLHGLSPLSPLHRGPAAAAPNAALLNQAGLPPYLQSGNGGVDVPRPGGRRSSRASRMYCGLGPSTEITPRAALQQGLAVSNSGNVMGAAARARHPGPESVYPRRVTTPICV